MPKLHSEKAIGFLNLTQYKDDIFLSMSKVDLAEIALAERNFDTSPSLAWTGS